MTRPAPGGWIGPYQLLRRLGAGGMGEVFEARHPGLGRSVALKLLSASWDPRQGERFQREGQVLARVKHPGVVEVHEAGVAPEGPYLVQELIEGESLDRVLQREGPLEPARAAGLAIEVADALAAVHATGALHRDLKPHNVVLRPDGRPVLIDFGLVQDREAGRLTRTGELLGSLAYMSPEQVEAAGELDERTDVYGLGALLYHLLCGVPPFQGATLQVAAGILERDPPWPRASRPDVPPALDAVVRRAMAKSPQDRFPSVRALQDALRAASENPVEAPRAPRRGWGLAAGVLLLLLAGVGVAARLRVAPAGLEASGVAPDPPTRPPRSEVPGQAPPRVAEEALWRLAPQQELEYELHLTEEVAGRGQLGFQAGLRLRVDRATAGVFRLAARVDWLRTTVGGSDELGLTYDSRRPEAVNPLAPLQGLVAAGFAFGCDLQARDGAVTAMHGWSTWGEAPGLERMSRVFSDAYMRASMHALTCVTEGAATVPWTVLPARAGRFVVEEADREPLLPAALVERDPEGTRCSLEGTARYQAGRLQEARLTQTARTGGERRRVVTWGMQLR